MASDHKLAHDAGDGTLYLHFSDEAQTLADQFLHEREAIGDRANIEPAVESHLVKGTATMPALALVFQVLEWAVAGEVGKEVVVAPTTLALEWMRLLEEHMHRVYGLVTNDSIKAAHALAKKIEDGTVRNGWSVRKIQKSGWSGLSSKETVEDALAVLEECGWIRLVEERPKVGRPSMTVLLHPDFLSTRAEAGSSDERRHSAKS